MKEKEMKERVLRIVEEVSSKYSGGTGYFTEVDAMIKSDLELLCSFCLDIYQKNKQPLLFSGEIGQIFLHLAREKNLKIPIMVANGGLRNGGKVVTTTTYNLKSKENQSYNMIDDSYYSGKTVQSVRTFLKESNSEVSKIFVFYDGSPKRKADVHSLYRYYQ